MSKQPVRQSPRSATPRKPLSSEASTPRKSPGRPRKSGQPARDGLAQKASGVAYETADTVMQAAVDGASSLSRQVSEMLNEQVVAGAGMVSQMANSGRLAADDLEATLPQLGGAMHRVVDRIDLYAETIKGQSVEEMVASASGLARRQPALVFGVAALAGFVLFHAFRSAPDGSARGTGRNET